PSIPAWPGTWGRRACCAPAASPPPVPRASTSAACRCGGASPTLNAGSDGTLSGWGRVPVAGREVRSEDLEALTRDAVLCRGLGRSYGDSSLPPPGHPVVAATPLADRILAFDAVTGTLRAEAGLSLRALNRSFLPRGFYAPAPPGPHMTPPRRLAPADA